MEGGKLLMKLNQWQIPVTIVCLISGLLISLQLQTLDAQPSVSIGMKNHDLVNMIKELEEANFQLEEEVDTFRSQIASYQEDLTSGEFILKNMQHELGILKDVSGLTEKNGNGIVLVIDDNKSGAEAAKANGLENYYPDEYIIHYKSVLYLINELREHSTAISVNNHRIVTNTDIRCVGTVILVNTTRLAPPYEIKAIGDPDQLSKLITSSYEYNYLESRGFPIKLTSETDLSIAAHRGTYRFNYAEPVKDGDH